MGSILSWKSKRRSLHNSQGEPKREPRREIAGAKVSGRIDECLDNQHRMPPAGLVVSAQASKRHSEHLRGEVLVTTGRKDAVALVVDDVVQPGEVLLV
jgi:hypothetical protein